MNERRRTILAVAVAAWCYVALVIDLVLAYRYAVVEGGAAGTGPTFGRFLDTAMFLLAWAGFPAVGALIAVRRPDNPVGWVVLLVGFSMVGLEPLSAWASLVVARGGEVVGPLLWGLGISNAWAVVPIVAFAHLLLLFPNGVLTRLGRVLSRVALAAAGFAMLARLLRPAQMDLEVTIANPFGVAWLPSGEELVGPATAVLFATAVVALLRLVVRHRRAGAVERKQFQWILWSLATLPVLWVLGNSVEGASYAVGQVVQVASFDLAFIGFAVALYRAVTKQDLYGIDRLVSRTLTYAGVSIVLVGTYLGLVVGLGAVARAATGESGDLVVALSTLTVAALFQPLRQRVRTVVDRRFSRARYDAARTIDAFGRSLRDEVSRDAVLAALRATTAGTFQPASVGVVLTGGGEP